GRRARITGRQPADPGAGGGTLRGADQAPARPAARLDRGRHAGVVASPLDTPSHDPRSEAAGVFVPLLTPWHFHASFLIIGAVDVNIASDWSEPCSKKRRSP